MCFFKKARDFTWDGISSFEFEYTTGNMMNASVCFRLKLEDGTYKASYKQNGVADDKAEVFAVDSEFAARLEQILKSYEVEKWHGFKKSDKQVLDGHSFYAYISNTKGQGISASGYMKWPKNYKEVKTALTELFESL